MLTKQTPDKLPPSTTLATFLDAHAYPGIRLPRQMSVNAADEFLNKKQRAAQELAFKTSLLESRRLVANRTYFYSDNYLAALIASKDIEIKRSLSSLMRSGALVPFLFTETALEDDSRLKSQDQARHRKWTEFVKESGQLPAVKLSWKSDKSALLGERFEAYARALNKLNVKRILQEFSLPQELEGELSREISTVTDLQAAGKWLGREDVYAYLMNVVPDGKTDPFTPSRVFSLSPAKEAVRQILDIRYATNLADVMNRFSYRLAGVRSRSVLQLEDQQIQGAVQFDAREHKQIAENLRAADQILEESGSGAIEVRQLRLSDIREVRETDEWLAYMKVVDRFVDKDRTSLDGHPLLSSPQTLALAHARVALVRRVMDISERAVAKNYREKLEVIVNGGLVALDVTLGVLQSDLSGIATGAGALDFATGRVLRNRASVFMADLRVRKFGRKHDSISVSLPVYRTLVDPDSFGRLLADREGNFQQAQTLTNDQAVSYGALEHKDTDQQ